MQVIIAAYGIFFLVLWVAAVMAYVRYMRLSVQKASLKILKAANNETMAEKGGLFSG